MTLRRLGLALLLVATWGHAPGRAQESPDELTRDEWRCQRAMSRATATLWSATVGCVARCVDERATDPSRRCETFSPDPETASCLDRARSSAEVRTLRTCAAESCPECYDGGSCGHYGDVQLSTATSIAASVAGRVFCADGASAGGPTPAERRCRAKLPSAAARLTSRLDRCVTACHRKRRNGRVEEAGCRIANDHTPLLDPTLQRCLDSARSRFRHRCEQCAPPACWQSGFPPLECQAAAQLVGSVIDAYEPATFCVDRPVCGDGRVSSTEACDPAVFPDGCAAGESCTLPDCTCAVVCGDGQVGAGEECDPFAVPTGCSPTEVCGTCTCEVPPDSCAEVTVVPAAGGTFSATTAGGSGLGGTCGGGGPERVFSWTPATSGQAVIHTCGGAAFDTVVYVRAADCRGGVQIACNDDQCGFGSRVTPSVTAGTTYFVVVDGLAAFDAGSFTLTVEAPPAVCGNGTTEPGEACDSGSAGGGFVSGECGFCNADCECEGIPECGDGVREGFEECDGLDLGSATCPGGSAAGALLDCRPDCTLDASNCPPVSFAMDPAHTAGFFTLPWPNDVRRRDDGTLDVAGWPGSETNPLAATVLARGAAVTTAFGTNAAVFLQATGRLDPASLPAADATLGDSAAAMLVDLDALAPERVPLLVDWKNRPTAFRPANLLALLPYPGYPLRGQTRYAAIVFDALRDEAGRALEPAPLLAALDGPWDATKPGTPAEWNALRQQRDDVFAYVTGHTSWSPAAVVAFTVFTTQDVRSEMVAIAAGVEALPAPTPVSRTTGSCDSSGPVTVSGRLDLPKWQAGEFPYLNDGGGIEVVNGMAIQQGTEQVDFEMTYPCGPAPAAGWPILLFMDGTGGCPRSRFIPYFGNAALPYVVLSISPLYSCERDPQVTTPEFLFFNFLNPLAGRTNQLQQAADMLYLERIAAGIVLSASETGTGGPVETDDARIVIAGHSQGALTVPHALSVDPALKAGFISAGGAGFYHSLVHRRDLRTNLIGGQGLDQLLGLEAGELDQFHPVVHILQTVAEVGDAANHAPYVASAHVLSVGGLKDGCSPWEVVTHLGQALGLGLGNPVLHPTFGALALEPSVAALPVVSNLAGGRTGVTVQLDTGHFGTVTNPALGTSFVESYAATGTPTVAPGVLTSDNSPGCAGRFDPLP